MHPRRRSAFTPTRLDTSGGGAHPDALLTYTSARQRWGWVPVFVDPSGGTAAVLTRGAWRHVRRGMRPAFAFAFTPTRLDTSEGGGATLWELR